LSACRARRAYVTHWSTTYDPLQRNDVANVLHRPVEFATNARS
jgi:hypothetical protein